VTEGNTYRDGKVHVLSEKCETCIFNAATRFVSSAGGADLVRETQEKGVGGHVVCHSVIIAGADDAICRGFFDRFKKRDVVLRMAVAMDVIKEVPPPAK
jgi:hypothetical protein